MSNFNVEQVRTQAREAFSALSPDERLDVIAWAIETYDYPLPSVPETVDAEPERKRGPVDSLDPVQASRAAAIRLMAPVSDSDGGTMLFARYVIEGVAQTAETGEK